MDCQGKQVKKRTKTPPGSLTSPHRVATESPVRQGKIIFVLGGDRSGKSRYALTRAEPYEHRSFIATALPIDTEMRQRIAAHRQERGTTFQTIEEPYDLGAAIRALPLETEVAVIDCLTVWLGNLLFKYGEELDSAEEIPCFFKVLETPPCTLVIVSNEIGLGVIPADPQTRHFRDQMGGLNQRVAALADEVVFLISGLPLRLKG